jgi:hypothetical protein
MSRGCGALRQVRGVAAAQKGGRPRGIKKSMQSSKCRISLRMLASARRWMVASARRHFRRRRHFSSDKGLRGLKHLPTSDRDDARRNGLRAVGARFALRLFHRAARHCWRRCSAATRLSRLGRRRGSTRADAPLGGVRAVCSGSCRQFCSIRRLPCDCGSANTGDCRRRLSADTHLFRFEGRRASYRADAGLDGLRAVRGRSRRHLGRM